MFIVILYTDSTTMRYLGVFDSYDEANDYTLLGIDVEDYSSVEIIELEKVTSAVV